MRYPGAKWIGANPQNYEAVTIVPRFLVLHIAEGNNQSGIDAWFNDPSAQVSSQLSVSKWGVVHEYVQMNQLAYHCGPWNNRAVGVEFLGYWGDDMTPLQRRRFRQIALWVHKEFHIPLRLTFDPYDPQGGFIAHGRIPEGALSHPECPGNPILIDANRILHQLSRKPVTLSSIVQSWLNYRIT
jgi:hypothetical protein